jgi:hypothetical protein
LSLQCNALVSPLKSGLGGETGDCPSARIEVEISKMPSQRDPIPVNVAQASFARVSVGQFAERFRAEVIPLSNTFGYYCATLPMSEEVVKEYLEEPVAALPPAIASILPRISILLVPYL